MILDAKKIEYQKFDVAADEAAKQKMRDISGNPKALPPQLCNGNQYCGVSDMHIHTYMHSFHVLCMYEFIHTYTYIHITYTYIHIHIHTYIYTYIHTYHIHIHT